MEGDLNLNHTGSNVTSWTDQSGNARNLDIVSATAPTYLSTALGGKPGSQFVAASSTFLAHAANIVGASGDLMLAFLARVDAAPTVDGTEAHIFDNISGGGGIGFGVNFFTPGPSHELVDLRPAGGLANADNGSPIYGVFRAYIITRVTGNSPNLFFGTVGAGNDCNAQDQNIQNPVTSWTDPGAGGFTANIAMGVRVSDAPAAANLDSSSFSNVTICAALICSNNNNSQVPLLFNYWNTKWSLPPVQTTPPTPQTAVLGQTATFSVTIDPLGGTPTYQWRKNGSNIGAATSSSYTTPATVITDHLALFDCVVTNLNGTTTTTPVPLYIAINPGMLAISA